MLRLLVLVCLLKTNFFQAQNYVKLDITHNSCDVLPTSIVNYTVLPFVVGSQLNIFKVYQVSYDQTGVRTVGAMIYDKNAGTPPIGIIYIGTGTISPSLGVGEYQIIAKVSNTDRFGVTTTQNITQPFFVGRNTGWNDQYDMIAPGTVPYSVKRNVVTLDTKPGKMISFNASPAPTSSTLTFDFIELRKSINSPTVPNSTIYCLLKNNNVLPTYIFNPITTVVSTEGISDCIYLEFTETKITIKTTPGTTAAMTITIPSGEFTTSKIRIVRTNAGGVGVCRVYVHNTANNTFKIVKTDGTLGGVNLVTTAGELVFPISTAMNLNVFSRLLDDTGLDVVSSFPCAVVQNASLNFAEPKRELDAGYVNSTNLGVVKFYLNEEYQITPNTNLAYTLYNSNMTPLISVSPTGTTYAACTEIATVPKIIKSFDDNRCSLDLSGKGLGLNSFYILEFLLESGEKRFLKFKYNAPSVFFSCTPPGLGF
jgi:hypothetical protein